jgi:hypothetical protein
MPRRFFPEMRGSFKIATVVFVVTGFSLIAVPAKAGFQWVAPAESAQPPVSATPNYPSMSNEAPPPSLTPAPAVPVTQSAPISVTPLAGEGSEISPIVIEGTPMPSSSQPAPAMNQQNASLGSLPSMPDTTVQGFANNVPLAVALREVLPPGYGFSIDQDVDLGTLVSFQGGRPWRDTLQSMLSPAGLEMREQNQMVAIGRVGSGRQGQMISSNGGEMAASPPPSTPQPLSPAVNPPQQQISVAGPHPAWVQPTVKIPQPVAPPQVASSRLSSAGVVDTWTATRGDTLHKTLQEWSRRAGTEFEWLAEYDYPLQASISYTGTYEDAVRSLLSGFEDAHPQPVAELHANPGAGQMVLVIQTRGNSYAD